MELWQWQLGGGALAGLAVAYTLKKATKLALLLLGLVILLLFGLTRLGIVTVQWSALTAGLELGSQSLVQWATTLVQELGASMVGFGGGVVLGLKLR
ncbi:FUN14 domain-containing protein [Candidatus Cyanaurora vandensis]|uniref:FUN14 domain-containing protein n=1 Tax=Candidatus Cyanaurora vandensis TaxID=2714958 RepID=UPI0025800245|nr:FUN14 domain-containing protein [Candidatus Cyanaurora vandensis]